MGISDCSSEVCSSEATSGTRLASAWAETDSSVPSLAGMVGGWVWALAVMVMQLGERARASASGQKGLRVMGGSVMDEVRVGTSQRTGSEHERGWQEPARGWRGASGVHTMEK